MTIGSSSTLKGGEWLLQASDPASVFTPERLSDEQRLVARTVSDFVAGEIWPAIDTLERKDWDLARRLVQRAGQLGLLNADVAEADGGEGLDKATSMVISE